MIIDDGAAAQDLDAALREVQAGAQAPARTQVSPRERAQLTGQAGVTVLVGGAAARARLIAFALERRLFDLGHAAHVLAFDGEPAAAIALAARACTEAGLVAICADADAAALRAQVGGARLIEVVPGAEQSVDDAVEQIVARLDLRR